MIMPDSNTPLWQNSQQKQKPTTRPGYQIQPPRIGKPNAMLLVDEIKVDPLHQGDGVYISRQPVRRSYLHTMVLVKDVLGEEEKKRGRGA